MENTERRVDDTENTVSPDSGLWDTSGGETGQKQCLKTKCLRMSQTAERHQPTGLRSQTNIKHNK